MTLEMQQVQQMLQSPQNQLNIVAVFEVNERKAIKGTKSECLVTHFEDVVKIFE